MTATLFGYAATASDDQHAAEVLRRTLLEHAKLYSLPVADVRIDRGVGGGSLDRPALDRLIAAAGAARTTDSDGAGGEGGRAVSLLVISPRHISPDVFVRTAILEGLRDKGIGVISIRDAVNRPVSDREPEGWRA